MTPDEIQLDEFNTISRKHVAKGVIDNYFKGGPNMKMIKDSRYKTFPGGTLFQENFAFKPSIAGPYRPGGAPFNLTRRQTVTGLQHTLVFYYANVTIFLEDIEVTLTGPEAAFSLVKHEMGMAALSLSQVLEIDFMHHGSDQTAAGGTNRTDRIKGIPEALSDGVTNSWEGFKHPIYGNQDRTVAALGDAMLPAGSNANAVIGMNVGGPPTNHFLEHSYASCQVGDESPKYGLTTRLCMSMIAEQQMPLKPLPDTMDQKLGIKGVQWKDAILTASDYMPGIMGKNDPDAGNYRTSASVGETLTWLNPGGEGEDAYFRMWFPQRKKFQFGFTGFKVSRDSTQLSGQILLATQLSWRSFRTMRTHYGLKQANAA